MHRYFLSLLILLAVIFALPACNGGSNPVTPGTTGIQDGVTLSRETASSNNRVLWGMYHVTLDPVTGIVEAAPLRTAQINVNVTQFLHPPIAPVHMIAFQLLAGLSDFSNGLFVLDVTLRHPFPGVGQYRGFDVRGIFMSDDNDIVPGDATLKYAADGASHVLNPDGYTRWWNPTDFTSESIFGFMPGKLAPPYYPTATLNGYKYFCDEISSESSLDEVSLESRGTFSPVDGINSRRYEIQFAMDSGNPVFEFNYAIDASWDDIGPSAPSYDVEDFPLSANCPEAWWIEIDSTQSSLWYSEPGLSGGELVMDVTVHDWQALEDGGSVPNEVAGIVMHSYILPDDMADIFSLGASLVASETGQATWRLDMDASELEISNQDTKNIWIEVLSASPDNYMPQIPGGDAWPFPDAPLAAYALGSVLIEGAVPQDPPVVLEVIPDWGYVDSTLTGVQVIGENFIADGLTVDFDNGSFLIPVDNVSLVSDTEITLDLDLSGADIDTYDVTVTVDNTTGGGMLEDTLEDGFEVREPIDQVGWPFLGFNSLRNCLVDYNGPQTSTQVYSVSIDTANAPETLLIGIDPDNPGDWLVYVGYYAPNHDFKAYRASDGSQKWSVSPPSGYSFMRVMAVAPPNTPCPDGEEGTVYVWAYPGETTTPEKILALSASDGSILWEYTAPNYGSWLNLERFGLVLENGDFAFCHANYDISAFYFRCLDVTDGSSNWVVDTKFHQTPDPVLSPDGNTIYFNCESSNTLRAFDMTTEPPSQKWSLYLGTYCPPTMQSTPIVASDGYIYEMGRTNMLVKVSDNGSSGSIVWATPSITDSQSAWVQLAEGPDGSIYAFCPLSIYTSYLTRFDPSDGAVISQSASVGVHYSTGMAIGADGKIYAGGRNTGIYCFNADCSNGWMVPVSGCRFTDAALLDDGSLFLADTSNGRLYRYKD